MNVAGDAASEDEEDARLNLVIASNYRQFVQWCRAQGFGPLDQRVRYIREAARFHGYDPARIQIVELPNHLGLSADIRKQIDKYVAFGATYVQDGSI